MVSTVSAQSFNDNTADSDWNGATTDTNSSLEGSNAQDSGDEFENDTTTVDVRVTSKVAVDIKPETLNYPYVDVGEQETKSNRSFESVTILNTGSEDISRIWLNSSYPTTDPLGGDASGFDAGNFFQVKIDPSSNTEYDTQMPDETSNYHYVNRVEYNFQTDSDVPSFITAPNGTGEVTIGGTAESEGTAPAEIEKGAFRVGGEEYYYVLLESTAGCTGTAATPAELRVANTSSTANSEGTYDFTDDGRPQAPRDWTRYTVDENADSDYGIVNGPSSEGVDLGNRNYDVLTACDEASFATDDTEHTLRTSFNVAPGSVDDLVSGSGGGTNFVFSGDGSDALAPNSFVTLNTAVEVPRGVSQGSVSSGTFRVFVTSDNDA